MVPSAAHLWPYDCDKVSVSPTTSRDTFATCCWMREQMAHKLISHIMSPMEIFRWRQVSIPWTHLMWHLQNMMDIWLPTVHSIIFYRGSNGYSLQKNIVILLGYNEYSYITWSPGCSGKKFQSRLIGLPHSTAPSPCLVIPSTKLCSDKYKFLNHWVDSTRV